MPPPNPPSLLDDRTNRTAACARLRLRDEPRLPVEAQGRRGSARGRHPPPARSAAGLFPPSGGRSASRSRSAPGSSTSPRSRWLPSRWCRRSSRADSCSSPSSPTAGSASSSARGSGWAWPDGRSAWPSSASPSQTGSDGLALELLHLRHDRLRGRDDLPRRAAAALAPGRARPPPPRLMLGAAAGILFGVSDISIKALTGTVPGDFLAIFSPWTLVAVAASVAAFYASARGLQVGEGVSVIALTSVSANSQRDPRRHPRVRRPDGRRRARDRRPRRWLSRSCSSRPR